MHVEMKNLGSGNCYYLCTVASELRGIVYHEGIRAYLADLTTEHTVREALDLIRPVLEKLMVDEPGRYEIQFFRFSDRPQRSLTHLELAIPYGIWRTGDRTYVDGKLMPIAFTSV